MFIETPGSDLSRSDKILYSPFLVQMVVTRRCNLACAYCNEFDRDSEPVPYELLTMRIDKAFDLGALAVEFTGGEPLLHPRIHDLVSHATARGIPYRMLITNAYLLNEEIVKRLNQAGLSKMQISVDTVKPNDSSAKALEVLQNKLEMLAWHAKFIVTLSAVIGVAPADETLEVLECAEKLGFLPRAILMHGHDGGIRAGNSDFEVLGKLRKVLGATYSEAGNYRERLLLEGRAPFKCRAGARYIYVDEHGDAMRCSQRSIDWKKNFLELSIEDLRQNFKTSKTCSNQCSIGCARTCSSWDEWRFQQKVQETIIESART